VWRARARLESDRVESSGGRVVLAVLVFGSGASDERAPTRV
jgi:3-isopropylmalate dehydratase small subunit